MSKRFGLTLALMALFILALPAAVLADSYYTVQPGDSLWKIARSHNTTVDKLKACNGLTSDRLQIGDRLKISGNPTSSAPTGLTGVQNQVSQGGQDSAAGVYVVSSGDSLWSIARRHGMTVNELISWNGLHSDKLQPGDKLTVKKKSAGTGQPTPAPTSTPSSPVEVTTSRGIGDTNLVRDIIATANQYLGSRYRYGGSSPKGFDCSGFVMYVFSHHGFNLPHSSRSQATLGSAVGKAELQAGDLVFFKTGGSKRINHVGIYTGDGKFIHASTNRGITIDTVNSGTYNQCYCCARRVL